MDFSVRPARTDDIPQMCDLLAELFSIESDFSPDREKQVRGLRLLLNEISGPSFVLVAENNSDIVGMCSVQVLISTAEGGPAGLLEDLIVRKDHRGKGIGPRLLSEIFKWCVTKNISRIQLLRDTANISALNFYAGNGWENTGLTCMRKLL
jgi:GNAT superfamily N-acetyltransferase